LARALVEGLALHIANDVNMTFTQRSPDSLAGGHKELFMTKITITSEGPGMIDRIDPASAGPAASWSWTSKPWPRPMMIRSGFKTTCE
jgi:hypothetical protein